MNENTNPTAVNLSSPLTAQRPLATELDDLLNRHFAGKVVRKDLTKLVKEGPMSPSRPGISA